jgi:deazaflavin-dependent oxidoreductase (nitroreductase family)
MSELMARDWSEQNRLIIAEYRASGGKIGGYFADKPLLLLTTVGAKTGIRRTSPLGYLKDSDRYVVFGSVVGEPRNPDWYYNLVAHPDVVVEVGSDTFDAVATVVTGSEREVLFARHAADHPQWARYQARTSRKFPVIALIRK